MARKSGNPDRGPGASRGYAPTTALQGVALANSHALSLALHGPQDYHDSKLC